LVSADVEPNDDSASAEGIVAGTYEGSVNLTDRVDVYKMQVAGSDIIGISFQITSSGTQYLEVKDAADRSLTSLLSKGGQRASVSVYVGCELDMEWWFLEVSVGPEGDESPGGYELSLFYDTQDDGGAACDAPCDFANALMLDAGEHTGEYGFHDTKDVYRVVVKAGWTLGLCLDCTEDAGPLKVQVFTDDDMTTPMKSMEVMDEETCSWLLPAATPVGTNWYVSVEGVTGDTFGEYMLRVDMEETDSGPPQIVKVTPKEFDPTEDLKVQVTIDEDTEIETAVMYYRKDGKGAWKQIALTLDGDRYTGKIKKEHLEGAEELHYYLVATDTTGFQNQIGTETEPEMMDSMGASPGYGAVVAAVALMTLVILLGRRR
jgi:hypothetical protein